MPIQTPLKHVKVGPLPAPRRTLMDIPEGILTIVQNSTGTLTIRKRIGRNAAYTTNASSIEKAETLAIPHTLPEGLSAPGNKLPTTPQGVAAIPDYRVFLANSVTNNCCRVLWFKVGSEVYYYDRMRHYEVNRANYEISPSTIDSDLAKQRDLWVKADNAPAQVFRITDWVVQVAD